MRWNGFELLPVDETKAYGFVVDHKAYWGIPIDGSDGLPLPESSRLTDLEYPPSKLLINTVKLELDSYNPVWTGGDFDLLATCTPPLFHALHHKTDEEFHTHQHMKAKFEPRPEINVIEREFSPRDPLQNKATEACVKLFSVEFEKTGTPKEIPQPVEMDFSLFDTENKIAEKAPLGYFETRQSTWGSEVVHPLNAIWFVILKKGANLPISRLGDGYRLWHHINHADKKTGYVWKIEQKTDNPHKYRVTVKLSGSETEVGLQECPNEAVTISFEYEWQ